MDQHDPTESPTRVSAGGMVPANLHIAVTCPQSTQAPLTERVEQKFFLPPGKIDRTRALLWKTCRFDPDFPEGQVNSLYFDAPDLDQHERSTEGDFAKDKIRIRWYGEEYDPHRIARIEGGPMIEGRPSDGNDKVRVWLELKSRRGFASTKQRTIVEVDPRTLGGDALTRGIVPAWFLLQTMAGFGFFPRGRLCPTVAISYSRYRFVEPRSGFRVSLDYRIRSSMVIPGIGAGERGLELPGAVVEVKGPRFELPEPLRPLADLGSSWTRFSKYSSSLDGHAEPRGRVSRLWPSGLMQDDPGALAPVRERRRSYRTSEPVFAYENE